MAEREAPMWLRLPWDAWVSWARAGIRQDVPPPDPSAETDAPADYDG